MRWMTLVGMAAASAALAACGGGGGGDASALCANPPANAAPQISDMYSTSPMPTSGYTGGTIVAGTYFMTAITNYQTSDSGGTHKDTLVIDPTAGTFVVDEVNGGKSKPTIAGTFTISGTTIKQTFACPEPVTAQVEYTATPTTLTFYNYDANSVSVFTKQ